MQKKKTGTKRSGWTGIVIIVLIYVLINVLPLVPIGLKKLTGGGRSREKYEDLHILGVRSEDLTKTEEWMSGELKKTVPELQDFVLEDGCQLYRFEVEMENRGTREASCDGSVYLSSGDGYAEAVEPQHPDDDQARDTRIIPPVREAVVTIYGQVSDDSTTVEFTNYRTRDGESENIEVDLFEDYEEEE